MFSSIFVAARNPRHGRYPGIPSLLDSILRDATQYFILLTLCNITTDAFLIFAPVGGHNRSECVVFISLCAPFQEPISELPGLYVSKFLDAEETLE